MTAHRREVRPSEGQAKHSAVGSLWQRAAHAAGTCGGPRAACPCCLDNLWRDEREPERHP